MLLRCMYNHFNAFAPQPLRTRPMKHLLIVAVMLCLCPGVASADHLGIYRDATAQSCSLDPGHNNSAVVMHRYSTGADWVHFRVDFLNAPGSTFVSFSSPFYTQGSLTSDLTVSYYPHCMTGSVVVGTITAILTLGYVEVAAPVGYPEPYYDSCDFTFYPIGAGRAYVGSDCIPSVESRQSTWGSVKALYR